MFINYLVIRAAEVVFNVCILRQGEKAAVSQAVVVPDFTHLN
jgi:hypothetical protein